MEVIAHVGGRLVVIMIIVLLVCSRGLAIDVDDINADARGNCGADVNTGVCEGHSGQSLSNARTRAVEQRESKV